MAGEIVSKPGLIVSFTSLLEDAGIIKPVADERSHIPLDRAILNNHGLSIGFPFVPDWLVWLAIIAMALYTLSFYGVI